MIQYNGLSNMATGLMIVITVIYALGFFLKKLKFSPKNVTDITVLSNMMLGTKERILLIKAEGTKLLIGVTGHSIQTLHVFTEENTDQTQNHKVDFKQQLDKAAMGVVSHEN